ncbi:D-alanyl-D-alanine carboxypeptidase family protein [Leptolyngbya sp. PCC 6406]|uniref:M15 family metallopeptidase n=1 Tax=Leptolyngbya sp. PCC 6406 TaxID=1173264 RepID=UPI0002ACA498|nr:M15 family metallopeptidase [Leptolyngbya sp. PCC 6406]
MAPNSFRSIDDVPEAQRDSLTPNRPGGQRGTQRWVLWFSVGLLSALAGLMVSWVTYQVGSLEPLSFRPAVTTLSVPPSAAIPEGSGTLLGHRPYAEAPPESLVPLPSAPEIQLHVAAAEALENMMAAARVEGVTLMPLSGFRSVQDQQYLFFSIKAERGQDATTRAEVSAPPGYSEHHTGYAVDLGDANAPETNVQINFEETAAFRWLQQNATRYSFELSFPLNNPQNIQYEPWHWRFVGDSASLETFYRNP